MKNQKMISKLRFIALAVTAFVMFCAGAVLCGCNEPDSSNPGGTQSESFELNVFSHTMLVDESYNLLLEAEDSVDLSGCVWNSSDKTVVTVDTQGYVLSVGTGSAVVTATIGNETSSCTFNVLDSNISPYLSVNAENDSLRLTEGNKFALSVAVEYNGNSYTDFTCKYTVSDKNVVTVSDDGEITAVAEHGKAMVTLNVIWRNGKTFAKTITVTVTTGAYISVDKTKLQLYVTNPDGYDFATSFATVATLIDKGDNKDAAFTVTEIVADGKTEGAVASYNKGKFTANGCGSTKFVFSCNYKGEDLFSDEITVTVSVPRISLKNDVYKVKANEISVNLADTGLAVTTVNKVFVNGTETTVNGTRLSLSSAKTGRYEIGFYINNVEAEYTFDLIVADKLISSVSDLLSMSDNLEGYYVLTQDIDAQGVNVGHLFTADWYNGSGGAIGNQKMKDKGFKGTIDGNGHTICNISVDGYGLFGTVSPEGTIKNLGIRNVMSTTTDGVNFPLATEFYGTMENVSFHMTNYTEYAPIGILQNGSVLKNVVFYAPNVTHGAICLMGDCVNGTITFENVFIFSNKNVGGIQGNAPSATVFDATEYKSDRRFTEIDFGTVFDTSDAGEWFIEDGSELPLIKWTPSDWVPLIAGESKPFKNNGNIVFDTSEFGTVKGIYVNETELESEHYSYANGSVTIYASYLSTMKKSTEIIIKTDEYRVKCVLQVAKEISTVEDFTNIENDLYGYYELSNNIDFGGESVQIKTWGDGAAWFNEAQSKENTGFYGTFEGNGHILKNFKTVWGIFGGIGDTAVIRNVGFENAVNITHSIGVSCVIALYSYGTVENISVKTADSSNFYCIIARMRGNAKLHNAVIYAKNTVVGIMESNLAASGSLNNVYLVSSAALQSGYTYFNQADYLTNSDFLAIDFTAIFNCDANGMYKMDDSLKLPFIYSDKEMPAPTVPTETKTYIVNNGVSNVTCSDSNVTVSMPEGAEGQLFLNGSFAGTPITLTFTLPETYSKLTGVSVGKVWTGGSESVSAWIGETYNASAIFINGAMGWSGWTNVGYQSTSANIAAAGYESSGNQVSITVQPSGGDQVVLLNLTFTYEVAI